MQVTRTGGWLHFLCDPPNPSTAAVPLDAVRSLSVRIVITHDGHRVQTFACMAGDGDGWRVAESGPFVDSGEAEWERDRIADMIWSLL